MISLAKEFYLGFEGGAFRHDLATWIDREAVSFSPGENILRQVFLVNASTFAWRVISSPPPVSSFLSSCVASCINFLEELLI